MSNDDDATQMPFDSTRSAGERTALGTGGHLPPGTIIRGFELRGVIAEGGFGIVYEAFEPSLERTVALKEYMPSALASRVGLRTVAVRSERHAETFHAGLKSFINEARLLAKYDHPSLVKVHQFWEENGTAYMVMPLYQGVTLKEWLRRSTVDETWLRQLLDRLLAALAVIHADQCFHRDIAPDNIILLADGTPVLLDFGAARRVIGDHTQALTVILKQGYAPIEQYAEVPGLKQGAWTDLYALGAVIHYAICGRPPETSVARIVSDSFIPLAERARGQFSEAFLKAIDRCLAVRPDDRPQSTDELSALLGGSSRAQRESREVSRLDSGKVRSVDATLPPRESQIRRNSKLPFILFGLAGLAIVVSVGTFLWTEISKPMTSTGSAQLPSPTTTPPVVELPSPPPPPPPPSPPEKPFSPVLAMDEVFAARDSGAVLEVNVPRPEARIGRDQIRFTISSARPGYLYVLSYGTSRDFVVLFPNKFDGNNRITAGQPVTLPRAHWQLRAEGPAGTSEFLAIASEHPLDFTGAGAVPGHVVPEILEFPLADSEQRYRSHSAARPLFAGRPQCPQAQPDCTAGYAAARFVIREVP